MKKYNIAYKILWTALLAFFLVAQRYIDIGNWFMASVIFFFVVNMVFFAKTDNDFAVCAEKYKYSLINEKIIDADTDFSSHDELRSLMWSILHNKSKIEPLNDTAKKHFGTIINAVYIMASVVPVLLLSIKR